jgi:hypothetical protein
MVGLGSAMVHCASAKPVDVPPTHLVVEAPPSSPPTIAPSVDRPKEDFALSCPAPADATVAQAHFEEGQRLLEESRDGELYRVVPFRKALSLLKSAGAKGHAEAQVLYAMVAFGDMFTGGEPREDQQDAYELALTYLRLNARRGHTKALVYIPGLETLAFDDRGHLPKPLPQPLDSLPAEWVRRALIESDRLAACP